MKLNLLSSFLALAGSVVARNCTPGLNYSGHTLLSIGSSESFLLVSLVCLTLTGNYQPQIDQSLFDNGVTSADGGRGVLFHCVGGANGNIQYLSKCGVGNCVDAGAGVNDFCE